MSVHFKVSGAWKTVERPYTRYNGTWAPAKDVYVRRGGVWVRAYEYDVVPPSTPMLSLEVVETTYTEGGTKKTGRHIKVGVRSSKGTQDTDLRRIRVLTTYQGKQPTTQYGGTYVAQPADNFEGEPWSDFQYNGYSGSLKSKPTNEFQYKRWPRNATNSNTLKGGETHYFSAWAEDMNGNWSTGVHAQITVPKLGVDAPNIKVKEGRFQVFSTGSFTGGEFKGGQPIQRGNPASRGLFIYGNQVVGAIGSEGVAKIRSAQVLLKRDDDNGAPSANVYLAWSEKGSVAAINDGGPEQKGGVKIGELKKGESKWFPLPEAFRTELRNNLRSLVLLNKDPNKASAFADDFSVMKSAAENARSGELHVVWEEEL